MGKEAQATTDHKSIRKWVEERGGWPATVKGTERGDEKAGMIRVDFPGYSGEGKLERITWDEFFRKFDEKNLAFLYQEETDSGERSFFNKLVSRETVKEREEEKQHAVSHR